MNNIIYEQIQKSNRASRALEAAGFGICGNYGKSVSIYYPNNDNVCMANRIAEYSNYIEAANNLLGENWDENEPEQLKFSHSEKMILLCCLFGEVRSQEEMLEELFTKNKTDIVSTNIIARAKEIARLKKIIKKIKSNC